MTSICKHFGACGGCALQDLSPEDYRARKRQIVCDALARAGLNGLTVEEPLVVPQHSRRRAVFKIAKVKARSRSAFMPPAATTLSTCANAWC